MVILGANRRHRPVPALAKRSLGVGIVATVGANLAHGIGHTIVPGDANAISVKGRPRQGGVSPVTRRMSSLTNARSINGLLSPVAVSTSHPRRSSAGPSTYVSSLPSGDHAGAI